MNTKVGDNSDKPFVHTTVAAELTGYSQDYVGQLCREERINCRRIAGQWHVDRADVIAYQQRENGPEESSEEDAKPAHGSKTGNVRDDTFTYDGVEYISSSRAASLTGYSQDYIGQLAREDEVAARKVGRRWFVGRKSLLEHKRRSDEMLAQVQAEAVGLKRKDRDDAAEQSPDEGTQSESGEAVGADRGGEVTPGDLHFNVRYFSEEPSSPTPTLSRPFEKHTRPAAASAQKRDAGGDEEPLPPLEQPDAVQQPQQTDGVKIKTQSRASEIPKQAVSDDSMRSHASTTTPPRTSSAEEARAPSRRRRSRGLVRTLAVIFAIAVFGGAVYAGMKLFQGEETHVPSFESVIHALEPYVPGRSLEYPDR